MPIISNHHWFRQWLGVVGRTPSPQSLMTNIIQARGINFVEARVKENVKVLHQRPLWGESTGHRWTPLTNGQLRGKCSTCWRHLVQCNKAKVTNMFDGWSSEPRSGTSTSNARMAAVSGWSSSASGMSTSLGPPFTLHYNDKKASHLDIDFIIRTPHPTIKGKAMGWLSWVPCIAKVMDANNLKSPLLQAMAWGRRHRWRIQL